MELNKKDIKNMWREDLDEFIKVFKTKIKNCKKKSKGN